MTTRDLEGCSFLVTGASSGVGRATVRGLVARGAEVFGASRSGNAGDATFGVSLDLTDPTSVRRVACDLASRLQHLDGLVNAAGGMFWKPAPTPFGVDQNWAVNYLGHALLTRDVWPLLEAAPHGRVATVAGNPSFLGKLRLDPARITATLRTALEGAGDAMSAHVIWTHTLARKHAGSHVTAIAFHPGLVRSNLGRDAP